MISAIQSALSSLASSIPDATHRMEHGAECGDVLFCSSRDLSGESVTMDEPVEMMRAVADRSIFPTIGKGSTVLIDDVAHIVTSAKTDPVGASVSIGLSAGLDSIGAMMKRIGTAVYQPVNILAVESDILEPMADAIAPTTCRAWFVCVSADEWSETTAPQIGDEFSWDGVRVRVATVKKSDGYWLLVCRARR